MLIELKRYLLIGFILANLVYIITMMTLGRGKGRYSAQFLLQRALYGDLVIYVMYVIGLTFFYPFIISQAIIETIIDRKK